ncbi:M1 family metallopeptidase [Oharaeibacter diazotrophicus]|uniref:Aminopeptidase N n=1 Tax=Oharaeibacter diazotrophicus TaxID=1920512 RepID=A0A4R6RJL1_9HYPH|nr:M1 family metallopeptidase [Oharaeibacter diazotrophicus]TDP86660.1 peptidase M1-like protein [Oharaeibacter diazotrophicus]BBE71398.1 aminopeptidase N [Pleomorphomonas sp. SM30]GLS78156.1 metallopeptidase [Oharaeibacter diazotrophicus]
MTRHHASAALVGAVLAATPALANDEFFPTFGNTGYDVQSYDIALDVDPAKNTIAGVATLTVVAERQLGVFTLDLAGLTVSSVKVDGVAAKFSRDADKLKVASPFPVRKGNTARVEVRYGGTPTPIQDPTAPGDPDYVLGWMHYKSAPYALSEPVGASTFYPANDEPTDRAAFRFRITVDEPFTAVANGDLVDVIDRGARRTFVWSMPQPMTTWLATVHVNKFKLSTAMAGRRPVRVYATAATKPADVKGYLKAAAMITWLEPLVGPYPYASYGSVTVDDPALYYALETQAMSTFPTGAADESIVVHELAHQWFGDSVSVQEWRDLWLAEGFATYIETLWPNRNDPAAFDAAMAGLYDYAKQKALGPAVVDGPEEIFSNRTYVRGGLTLYALRQKVGDKVFFQILKSWASWFRGQAVDTQDFIDTAVLVSGDQSVRPLLDAWLYQKPLPDFPAAASGAAPVAANAAAVANLVGLRCGLGRAHGSPAASCGN